MRVLILGASGMLGSSTLRILNSEEKNFQIFGTVRSKSCLKHFLDRDARCLIDGIDALSDHDLIDVLEKVRPDAVINCIGVIKQLHSVKNPLHTLPINALFPHRLAHLCKLANARLVHISTDCVFTGNKGGYVEGDFADARDLYGLSKYLGEVDYPHAVTLRTSIIGHELGTSLSLVDWFLAQDGPVDGFCKAIFSGLPTNELARVIGTYVLSNPSLSGLYHVSAEPISKYDLLRLIAEAYGHRIMINPSDRLVIDRSLDSTHFQSCTGYRPPSWPELIANMRLAHPGREQAIWPSSKPL